MTAHSINHKNYMKKYPMSARPTDKREIHSKGKRAGGTGAIEIKIEKNIRFMFVDLNHKQQHET